MNLLSTTDHNTLKSWIETLKEFQLDSIFDTHILGRAYLYTDKITITKNEENHITSFIGDSKYEAQIIYQDSSIIGKCSCPYDGKCKHLAALLLVRITRL